MERNNEKRRRAKYATEQPISSSIKYRDNVENAKTISNARKYRQNNEIDETNDKNERRRSNLTTDNDKSYYCPVDVPKVSRRHGIMSSSRVKYVDPYNRDEFHDIDNQTRNQPVKLSRNDLLQQYVNTAKYGKNIAVVRKDHRRENFREVEVPENSAFNDNDTQADETNDEIVDEERNENTTEFDEQYYEQREPDDETDVESDVFQRNLDKMTLQRKVRMKSSSNGQKILSAPISSRYTRGSKICTGKTLKRCCRSAVDRKSPEISTAKEDAEEPEMGESLSYCPRKMSWKSRSRDENSWIPGRNLMERYSNLPEKSLLPDKRQIRRPRTTRPEMEKSMKSAPRYESVSNIKCDRCGRISEQTPKTISSRNASCRLQDSKYFIGEPKGDDFFEDSTSGPISYQRKLRRSKGSRSPIHESNEKKLTIDKDDKAESRGICTSRRGNNNLRETTILKRSSVRADDRHEEQSKNNKYYWTER